LNAAIVESMINLDARADRVRAVAAKAPRRQGLTGAPDAA